MFRRHDAWMPAAVIGLGIMVIACGEGKLDSPTLPSESLNEFSARLASDSENSAA